MKLILGFIPLLDCAPLVAAAEFGFAAQESVDLALVRETSWANIRDRLIVGHFDVAHMLGPMTVATTLGVGHVKVPVIAPFALGLGGNAITISRSIWERMTAEGASLGADPAVQGQALRKVVTARARAGLKPLTFGMVYPFSCHNYELRYWLAGCGIDPDHDVRLVVIPPPFLVDAMRAGQIDGFCVGEPWNSVAVDAGVGVIVAPTTAVWPMSPEKVLGCRIEWAQRHPILLAALLRALHHAAVWCEKPENHAELARKLAEPKYVGTSAELLQLALDNQLSLAQGSLPTQYPGFYSMASHAATFPWVSHALWYYTQMIRWRQHEYLEEEVAAVRATYRPDLYRAALGAHMPDIPKVDEKVERFFDDRLFDPADMTGYLRGLRRGLQ
jgi:two-component system, oxyanion-binding sensor